MCKNNVPLFCHPSAFLIGESWRLLGLWGVNFPVNTLLLEHTQTETGLDLGATESPAASPVCVSFAVAYYKSAGHVAFGF
jgi:hypothetical protein